MTASRREFLGRVAAAAAGAILGGCASGGPAVYRYEAAGNVIDLFLGWYPELTRTGGAVELLLSGTERSVVVVRSGIDRFAAVSPLCPQDACRVELRENLFRCPCDGAGYALDGAPTDGSAAKPLVTYRTEFRETSLRIFLG